MPDVFVGVIGCVLFIVGGLALLACDEPSKSPRQMRFGGYIMAAAIAVFLWLIAWACVSFERTPIAWTRHVPVEITESGVGIATLQGVEQKFVNQKSGYIGAPAKHVRLCYNDSFGMAPVKGCRVLVICYENSALGIYGDRRCVAIPVLPGTALPPEKEEVQP